MWQSTANEIYFRLSIVNLFPVSNWTIFSDEEKRMRAHNRDKRLTGFHHFTWELVGCCDYTICQNYRAWIINCVWTVFPTAWLLILDEYFIVFEFYRTDGAPNDIFLSIFHSFAIGCMQRLWYNATISMNTPKTESVLFKRLNLFLDMKGYGRIRNDFYKKWMASFHSSTCLTYPQDMISSWPLQDIALEAKSEDSRQHFFIL